MSENLGSFVMSETTSVAVKIFMSRVLKTNVSSVLHFQSFENVSRVIYFLKNFVFQVPNLGSESINVISSSVSR